MRFSWVTMANVCRFPVLFLSKVRVLPLALPRSRAAVSENSVMCANICRFAEFELDRSAYQLRRNGRPLKLERIPLDLLFLLVERRGQLITREEILTRIWGKDVFLDSDNAVNSAVRKIRRALRDDPETPRFVVTVPTKGYRFAAGVQETDEQTWHDTRTSLDDRLKAGASFPDSSAPESLAGSDFSTSSVRYAVSGAVHIAYRIFGDGPRDIVLIPGTLSHLEILWETPAIRHLLKRLTAFARVIVFDKRGQGLSDRVVAEQTLEERIDDVRAVMDAAGSKRATIYGWSEGGPMSLMFAAAYPSRATALVLYGTFASIKAKPWAAPREEWEEMLREWEAHWGEGILLAVNAPSLRNDQSALQWCGKFERASASPGSIVALMRANYELDVRHVLPAVTIPTLVLHRTGDALVPVAAGRYLAEHIPGARYTELPGDDHTILDQETQDIVADEIEEFITSIPHHAEADRVLATVMFADIVGSTDRAGQLGARRWHELLRSYHELLRTELATFHGREVKIGGDGLLATFDGPTRAIRFACSARGKVHQLGLQIRAGLHTGECESIGDDVVGLAVHIAEQVASLAKPDEVLLSSTVKDLVAGSRIHFMDRGMHTLKDVHGEWHIFEAH
jgi:class 3 adenylate cyclase/DNA-binding winged helix-turn-helix (wHTH) protein